MRLGGVLRCRSVMKQQYVPQHKPALEDDIKRLEDFLLSKPNILVLTGAGISTESGKLIKRILVRVRYDSNIMILSLQAYPTIAQRVSGSMRAPITSPSSTWSSSSRLACANVIGLATSLVGPISRPSNRMVHTMHWLALSVRLASRRWSLRTSIGCIQRRGARMWWNYTVAVMWSSA